jgi:predicted N-formylglutamate amidohydrolase
MEVIITCEHAGNNVPEEFKYLFNGNEEVLKSHRGWDPGSFEAALFLSESTGVPVHHDFTSRLLIELNRSLDHPELFSEFSNGLSVQVKDKLIHSVYLPYRKKVEDQIAASSTKVLHLSMHSFVPALNNKVRELEIGLLFDPRRKFEVEWCNDFRGLLKTQLPDFRIAFNEPYLGIDDGFTTYLRTKFPQDHYLGIEIEINQKLLGNDGFAKVKSALLYALNNFIS